jgi:hypothetical protein
LSPRELRQYPIDTIAQHLLQPELSSNLLQPYADIVVSNIVGVQRQRSAGQREFWQRAHERTAEKTGPPAGQATLFDSRPAAPAPVGSEPQPPEQPRWRDRLAVLTAALQRELPTGRPAEPASGRLSAGQGPILLKMAAEALARGNAAGALDLLKQRSGLAREGQLAWAQTGEWPKAAELATLALVGRWRRDIPDAQARASYAAIERDIDQLGNLVTDEAGQILEERQFQLTQAWLRLHFTHATAMAQTRSGHDARATAARSNANALAAAIVRFRPEPGSAPARQALQSARREALRAIWKERSTQLRDELGPSLPEAITLLDQALRERVKGGR